MYVFLQQGAQARITPICIRPPLGPPGVTASKEFEQRFTVPSPTSAPRKQAGFSDSQAPARKVTPSRVASETLRAAPSAISFGSVAGAPAPALPGAQAAFGKGKKGLSNRKDKARAMLASQGTPSGLPAWGASAAPLSGPPLGPPTPADGLRPPLRRGSQGGSGVEDSGRKATPSEGGPRRVEPVQISRGPGAASPWGAKAHQENSGVVRGAEAGVWGVQRPQPEGRGLENGGELRKQVLVFEQPTVVACPKPQIWSPPISIEPTEKWALDGGSPRVGGSKGAGSSLSQDRAPRTPLIGTKPITETPVDNRIAGVPSPTPHPPVSRLGACIPGFPSPDPLTELPIAPNASLLAPPSETPLEPLPDPSIPTPEQDSSEPNPSRDQTPLSEPPSDPPSEPLSGPASGGSSGGSLPEPSALSSAAARMAGLHGRILAGNAAVQLAAEVDLLLHLLALPAGAVAASGSTSARLLPSGLAAQAYSATVLQHSGELRVS